MGIFRRKAKSRKRAGSKCGGHVSQSPVSPLAMVGLAAETPRVSAGSSMVVICWAIVLDI